MTSGTLSYEDLISTGRRRTRRKLMEMFAFTWVTVYFAIIVVGTSVFLWASLLEWDNEWFTVDWKVEWVTLGNFAIAGGVAAALTVVMFLASYYFGSRLVGRAFRAYLLSPVDDQRLVNVVQEIAIAATLPSPTIWVYESETPNAFAVGHNANHAVICVSNGLRRLLNRDELSAVVAHEMAHIRHGDILLNTMLAIFTGFLPGVWALTLARVDRVLALAWPLVLWQYLWSKLNSWISSYETVLKRYETVQDASLLTNREARMVLSGRVLVVIVGLGIPVFLVAFLFTIASYVLWLVCTAAAVTILMIGHFANLLCRFGISREREFLADAGAVELTRHPLALMSALEKVTSALIVRDSGSTKVFAHLFFASSPNSSWIARLFETHPTIEERINRIQALVRASSSEEKKNQVAPTLTGSGCGRGL